MLRRVIAAVLLMLVCVVYAPVGVANAYSVPWVPPSTVSDGDSSWISGTPVSGGWSFSYAANGPAASPCVVSVQRVEYTGTSVDLIVSELGTGDCGPSSYWATRPTLTCGDGWSAGAVVQYGGTLPKTKGWGSFTSSYPYSWLESACAAHGGMAGGRLSESELPGSVVSHWAYEVALGGVATIDMLCSNGTGLQAVSVTGVGVSAECPAGMVVVGGSVSVGGQVKSEFTRPGGSSLEAWAACMRGECTPMVVQGGYSCDPTMVLSNAPEWCKRVGYGGQVPTESDCVWQAPLALGSILLTRADCASWIEGVAGPPVDDPEDPDLGIITEWLQRIKSAIDGVKGAVDEVKSAVVGVGQSIVDAIEGIGEKLDELANGSGGGTGVGPGPGAAPGPSGNAGDLAGKFGPWLDLWGSMTGAGFGAQASDCRGPAMQLSLGDQVHTWYLLDACGARAQLATVSRVVLSVVLVWAAVMATIRVLASALGLQLKMGE